MNAVQIDHRAVVSNVVSWWCWCWRSWWMQTVGVISWKLFTKLSAGRTAASAFIARFCTVLSATARYTVDNQRSTCYKSSPPRTHIKQTLASIQFQQYRLSAWLDLLPLHRKQKSTLYLQQDPLNAGGSYKYDYSQLIQHNR